MSYRSTYPARSTWSAPDHTCLRHSRCPDYDPERGHGTRIETTRGLCASCERRLVRVLDDLPRLYAQLETIIAIHQQGGEKVSGTRDNPIPPRIDVLTMQAEIDAVTSAWAPAVAGRVRVDWPDTRHTRAGYRVDRASRLLAGAWEALLTVPVCAIPIPVPRASGYELPALKRDGLEAAVDLLDLADRARRLLTGGSGHSRLPVPCPTCEAPALVRRNGADQVDCESCGRRWPESDYRRLCLILADDYAPDRVTGRDVRRAA